MNRFELRELKGTFGRREIRSTKWSGISSGADARRVMLLCVLFSCSTAVVIVEYKDKEVRTLR